ncbi:MAG: oxaloacetate decarboxylase [Deltaproteobacteria bacterium]|nr:oxaloacetate decarboxylase [Deltaproteobacteria bacterium]
MMPQDATQAPAAGGGGRVLALLEKLGTAVFPGVYDAVSAKLAEQAGFEMIFISGYSVSAARLGEPDFGLVTQSEMVEAARSVCRSVRVPVIVDADTGYGNALNVMRTVKDLIAAGAAGMFLEDQVWPKRCGHMKGKKIVPMEEYLQKIRAAVDARAGRDFFIVARTDANQAVGLEEAIRRVKAARDAGADAAFVEAPNSIEELRAVASAVPPPLVANMLERGITPLLTREELRELGYALAVCPLTGLYAAAKAMKEIFAELRANGTTRGALDKLITFDEFHDLVGLEEKYALDAKYAAD